MKHSINCYFCGNLFDERECQPADKYNDNDGGDICPLCAILLDIGGKRMSIGGIEEDYENIKKLGRRFNPETVHINPGVPSQCHRNTALCWEANREKCAIFISTGYGLSKDGIWRQHSWCVLLDEGDLPIVVETTVKRIEYFGFILTEQQANDFYDQNL